MQIHAPCVCLSCSSMHDSCRARKHTRIHACMHACNTSACADMPAHLLTDSYCHGHAAWHIPGYTCKQYKTDLLQSCCFRCFHHWCFRADQPLTQSSKASICITTLCWCLSYTVLQCVSSHWNDDRSAYKSVFIESSAHQDLQDYSVAVYWLYSGHPATPSPGLLQAC